MACRSAPTLVACTLKETVMRLIESIRADAPAIAAMRRDIHAHPELCFEEQRTSDLIARALEGWGIPVHRGLGKTGVVGIVKSGSSERAVGLRADIDALPITERKESEERRVGKECRSRW